MQICKITKEKCLFVNLQVLCLAFAVLQWTKIVDFGDCIYLRSNINRNTSMSQKALNVVRDKTGKELTPKSLYTYTQNGGCFWQTWTMNYSEDAQQARIYYVPTDVLVYKYLDPKTNHVWFDVDERRHPTYGSIKSCSLTIDDVAKYVIPAHRNCIRHPGRILNASTDHLTVGNHITVNPDYACI